MPVRVESPGPFQASGANSEYTKLSACTLLSAGLSFCGTQNVSSHQKDEAWIHGCDLERGYLCGTMEALNVATFWEGEIADAKNYNFFTGKWQATSEVDIRHWSKFPSFSPLLSQVEADGGKSLDLSKYPWIFMRWKEQYFVNVGTYCGLAIADFNYVASLAVMGLSMACTVMQIAVHFRSLSLNQPTMEDPVSVSHCLSSDRMEDITSIIQFNFLVMFHGECFLIAWRRTEDSKLCTLSFYMLIFEFDGFIQAILFTECERGG